MKRYVVLALLMLSFSVFGQDANNLFRGKVECKIFDLNNDPTQGVMARTLANMKKIDIEELDTLYRDFLICSDTLVLLSHGVNNIYQYKAIEFGEHQYVYNYFSYNYLKLPKAPSMFGAVAPNEWKKNKKFNKTVYDYYLRKPTDQKLRFFVNVDHNNKYLDQFNSGGWFKNLLHPSGRIDKIVFKDGATDNIFEYSYQEDPDLDCSVHFDDFITKDMIKEAEEIFSYQVNTSIIPKDKRRRISFNSAVDTIENISPNIDMFKGKYVYVDLWASWCGPCILEMRYMAELANEFKGRNIEFLSISIDEEKNRSRWLKSIHKLKMNWHNWIIYGGFDSPFASENNIEVIPRYIIIDKEGKIVNSNAPRPSDNRLSPLIEQVLLNE